MKFYRIGLILGIIFASCISFASPVPVSAHIATSVCAYYSDEATDPINVVWWEQGDDILSKFYDVGWSGAIGWTCEVYFQDSINNGTDYWKNQDYQVEDPDAVFFGERIHVRIFESNYIDPHTFNYWAVGSAHREHWSWDVMTHVVDSWEDGEDEVLYAFYGQEFTGDIGYSNYNNTGYYQSVYNNGSALFIELID